MVVDVKEGVDDESNPRGGSARHLARDQDGVEPQSGTAAEIERASQPQELPPSLDKIRGGVVQQGDDSSSIAVSMWWRESAFPPPHELAAYAQIIKATQSRNE